MRREEKEEEKEEGPYGIIGLHSSLFGGFHLPPPQRPHPPLRR